MQINYNEDFINLDLDLKSKGIVQIIGNEEKSYIMDSFLGQLKFKGVAKFLNYKYRYFNKFIINKIKNKTFYVRNAKLEKFNQLSLFDILQITSNDKEIMYFIQSLDLNLTAKYETMSAGETVLFNIILGLISDNECIILDDVLPSLDYKRKEILLKMLSSFENRLIIILTQVEEEVKSNIIIYCKEDDIDIKKNEPNLISKRVKIKKNRYNSNSNTPQLSLLHRITILVFGLISTLISIYPFSKPYNDLTKVYNVSKIISNRSSTTGELKCYGNDYVCHFETFFFLFSKKINFVVDETKRDYLSFDIVNLFPDNNAEAKAFQFFKKYFNLEFSKTKKYTMNEYYVYITKNELNEVQKLVYYDGHYLIPDILEIIKTDEVKFFSKDAKEDIYSDKYAIITEEKAYNIIYDNNTIFKKYGSISSKYSNEDYIYLGHVHPEALEEYKNNGGFSNYKNKLSYSNIFTFHIFKNPLEYYTHIPELKKVYTQFLITILISLSVTLVLGIVNLIIFIKFRDIKITSDNVKMLLATTNKLTNKVFLKYILTTALIIIGLSTIIAFMLSNLISLLVISFMIIQLIILCLILYIELRLEISQCKKIN